MSSLSVELSSFSVELSSLDYIPIGGWGELISFVVGCVMPCDPPKFLNELQGLLKTHVSGVSLLKHRWEEKKSFVRSLGKAV